jgi:hypothetical protein
MVFQMAGWVCRLIVHISVLQRSKCAKLEVYRLTMLEEQVAIMRQYRIYPNSIVPTVCNIASVNGAGPRYIRAAREVSAKPNIERRAGRVVTIKDWWHSGRSHFSRQSPGTLQGGQNRQLSGESKLDRGPRFSVNEIAGQPECPLSL